MGYTVALNAPYRCGYAHVIEVVLDCDGILLAITTEGEIPGHIPFNIIAHTPFIQITDIHKAVGDGAIDRPEVLGNGGASRQQATGTKDNDKAAEEGNYRPVAVPGSAQTCRHQV